MLDARVATLRDRGWESLRPLAGRVVRSYFGGRVQEITDDDAEFSEIYGPSGALYHLTTSAWWWHAEGEDLTIESEIQEDGPARRLAVHLLQAGARRHLHARVLMRAGGSGTMHTMDASELRSWCLAQPGAIEDFPFTPEHSVFKVAGKMFALSALERTPLEVSIKCEPDMAVQFRDTYEAIRAGYHLNKRHWNTITLDGSLPDQLVCDMIEDSYDLVVSALPKRTQQQLGWPP